MIALSIRQPWAWLIAHGIKDVENRTWKSDFRGWFCIHASRGMTDEEYEIAADFAAILSVVIPEPDDLARGGIVGYAEMVDCVRHSSSPWYTGPYAFVIRNARPALFKRCAGRLKFFELHEICQEDLP